MEKPVENISLSMTPSPKFIAWMAEQRTSLVFTSPKNGKIFFIGLQPDGRLSVFERTFPDSRALWSNGQELYLSSTFQIWQFENALQPGQLHQGFDRLYVPQLAYTTGNLDIHDLSVDINGRIIFVNTLFSCLATVNDHFHFLPLWQPPFITELNPEDRCHLSGLALEEGIGTYVTAFSNSNTPLGWQENNNQGIVMNINTDEIIAEGLSLPHAPRCYQNKLWLLNSGKGELGFIDKDKGQFEAIEQLPGFARGLTFLNDFAIVAVSKLRADSNLSDLKDLINQSQTGSQSGIFVIDLRTGKLAHSLIFEGILDDIENIIYLPGIFRPMALGLKTEEIERIVTIGPKPS